MSRFAMMVVAALCACVIGCSDVHHPSAPSDGNGESMRLTVRKDHVERVGSCWPDEVAARLLATGNWEISPNIILCLEGYTPIRLAKG